MLAFVAITSYYDIAPGKNEDVKRSFLLPPRPFFRSVGLHPRIKRSQWF